MKRGEYFTNNFFVINQTHFASPVNKGEVSIYLRIYSLFGNLNYYFFEFANSKSSKIKTLDLFTLKL